MSLMSLPWAVMMVMLLRDVNIVRADENTPHTPVEERRAQVSEERRLITALRETRWTPPTTHIVSRVLFWYFLMAPEAFLKGNIGQEPSHLVIKIKNAHKSAYFFNS